MLAHMESIFYTKIERLCANSYKQQKRFGFILFYSFQTPALKESRVVCLRKIAHTDGLLRPGHALQGPPGSLLQAANLDSQVLGLPRCGLKLFVHIEVPVPLAAYGELGLGHFVIQGVETPARHLFLQRALGS